MTQIVHQPLGGGPGGPANASNSFNNRVADSLTDQQRTAYHSQFGAAQGNDMNDFNKGPLSPPSNNENPLAQDWNRLDPDNRLGSSNKGYPEHLAKPQAAP